MCDVGSAILGASALLGLGMSAKQGHEQRKAMREQEEAQQKALAEQEAALKEKGPEATVIEDAEKRKKRLNSVRAGLVSTVKTSERGLLSPAPVSGGFSAPGSKKKLGE